MRLHLYKRGDVWWCRGSAGGVKFRKSTRHTSKVLAERVRVRWEKEIADPVHFRAHEATVDSAAERFMSELRVEARSAGTVRFYDVKVRHVRRLLGRVRLAQLTREHVLKYIHARAAEGAHQYSVHRELTALRRTLRSAQAAQEWRGDVKAIIPRFATGYEPKKDWVTPEEVWAAIRELLPERGRAVAFVIATAADFSSIFTAERTDVGDRVVRVRGTKTSTRLREVPRGIAVFEQFLAHALEGAPETGPMFAPWGSMARDVRRACRRAGVREFTAKTLRRSAATWMVRAGVPFELAAKFLGHGSTAMLFKVYGQLAPADAGRLIEERTRTFFDVPALYPATPDQPDHPDDEES